LKLHGGVLMGYIVKFVDVDPYNGPAYDIEVLVEFDEKPSDETFYEVEDIMTNNAEYYEEFDTFADFVLEVLKDVTGIGNYRVIEVNKEIMF
jgi:hypothetical protein